MQATIAQLETIAPLLKEVVAAEIRRRELVAQIELVLAGPYQPERVRCQVETTVAQYVEDFALDAETAEGIGVEDARAMVEEI